MERGHAPGDAAELDNLAPHDVLSPHWEIAMHMDMENVRLRLRNPETRSDAESIMTLARHAAAMGTDGI